jgi:hypothetical protein
MPLLYAFMGMAYSGKSDADSKEMEKETDERKGVELIREFIILLLGFCF